DQRKQADQQRDEGEHGVAPTGLRQRFRRLFTRDRGHGSCSSRRNASASTEESSSCEGKSLREICRKPDTNLPAALKEPGSVASATGRLQPRESLLALGEVVDDRPGIPLGH